MLKGLKKPDDLIRLEKIKSNLEFRNRCIKELRNFFSANDFIEIETPIMIQSPAPEDYINAPQVGDFFLRTSPELHMKRLIAAGYNKIFQIGPCFRKGEIGTRHNEEFTMLEWYETGKDYNDILDFTRELLLKTIKSSIGSTSVNFNGNVIEFETDWKVYSVRDAFRKFANVSPEQAIKENRFELLLTEKIEPNLPKNKPVILKDYPASMAALSRLSKKDNSLAERWELYLGGIEIANAYSELIDPAEQRRRFNIAHSNRKKSHLPEYPDDSNFFEAIDYGMPEYTGIALGIDRLMMILTDTPNIKGVISFTEQRQSTAVA